MIRILIADDHAIVRRGLRQIVAEYADLHVTGEAQNAQEVLQLIRRQLYDVLMLDLHMPGRDGLEVLHDIKQLCPKLPILVLSMYPEDQFGMRVLKAGAADYLTKETAPEELVKAIRKVHGGEHYVSSTLAEKMASALQADSDKPAHETLTDREYEVLCRIASGKTVTQIAEELSLSVKTISTYRARILEKMHFQSNAELTHYSIRHELVD